MPKPVRYPQLVSEKSSPNADTNSLVLDIVNDVFDLVSDIDDAQHAQEEAFTQNTVDYLIGQYPTWNVLVFHDQVSTSSTETSEDACLSRTHVTTTNHMTNNF